LCRDAESFRLKRVFDGGSACESGRAPCSFLMEGWEWVLLIVSWLVGLLLWGWSFERVWWDLY